MSRIENQKRLFLELLGQLRPTWRSHPNPPHLLTQWLASHRAGSRDRKLYRELAYTAWRSLPDPGRMADDDVVAHVANRAERTKATAGFIDAFRTVTTPPRDAVATLLPPWMADECPALLESPHADFMLQRAPLWIRLQTDSPQRVAEEFTLVGIAFERSTVIPDAWRVATDAPVQATRAYAQGEFEIQDLGSQSLLLSLPQPPSGHWLDACAGAGGKTLQLARLLGRPGRVTAHDIRPAALQELSLRAARARLQNITIDGNPMGSFDGVLVDAPCSGTGTWRRSPHLKWTTTRDSVRAAAVRQQEILQHFSAFVAPGGWLVYATCSVCRSENQDVANAFAAANSAFEPAPLVSPLDQTPVPSGQRLVLPGELDSDGYFVAAFRRRVS